MTKFGGNFFGTRPAPTNLTSTALIVAFLFGFEIVAGLFHPQLRGTDVACASQQTEKLTLEKKVEPPPPVVTNVVVPLRDIRLGTTLSADMFETRTVLADLLPKDVVVKLEDVEGNFSERPLPRGTLLFSRDITPIASELLFHIPAGSRAITIDVDSTTSVEGFARPGTTVDVNFIFTSDKGEKTVTTLVHNARVVSVNGATTAEEFVPTAGHYPLTLVVAEKDAKAIQLASNIGELSLSLLSLPEQIVADPTLDSFTLPSLLKTEVEPEQTFTPLPVVMKTESTKTGREQLLITNRVTKPGVSQ